MKIAVVGTGYVGLVTGTCFSETGNTVTCIDIDAEKVKKLNSGKITIYEPGLELLFERNHKTRPTFFTTDLKQGIARCTNHFFSASHTPLVKMARLI
jgi:UDPglucose 6-dehydrogenase